MEHDYWCAMHILPIIILLAFLLSVFYRVIYFIHSFFVRFRGVLLLLSCPLLSTVFFFI